MNDPAYGGEKFSPAIIGNGTYHKYLLYFNSKFPYIHQNIVTINLGTSYSVERGVDVFTTMTRSQGTYVKSTITYPTGLVEESADDLHTATYMADSLITNPVNTSRYTDDYTNVITVKASMSKMGYSFVIGIIATTPAYCIGIPMGLVMAPKKNKFIAKLGTLFIVFFIIFLLYHHRTSPKKQISCHIFISKENVIINFFLFLQYNLYKVLIL